MDVLLFSLGSPITLCLFSFFVARGVGRAPSEGVWHRNNLREKQSNQTIYVRNRMHQKQAGDVT